MKPFFARLHTVLAWLIFLGCALLIYLIALSYFGGADASLHGSVGRILFLLSLLLAVTALVTRSSRLNLVLSILIPVMLFAQGLFIYLPSLPPAGRALHALNGLTIMALSYLLAHGRARATVKSDQPSSVSLAGDWLILKPSFSLETRFPGRVTLCPSNPTYWNGLPSLPLTRLRR